LKGKLGLVLVGSMSIFSFCLESMTTSFVQVPLPKYLVIENRRLGILFRFFQVCAIGVVGLYVYTSKPWVMDFTPVGKGLALWRESPDATLKADNSVPHCSDLSSYTYRYSSSWAYNATSCKTFPTGDMYFKESTSIAYFATFVKDTEYWHSSDPADCGADTEAGCIAGGGSYSASGSECQCDTVESSFAKNAEEDKVAFLHGYEVSRTSDGSSFQSAVSVKDEIEIGNKKGNAWLERLGLVDVDSGGTSLQAQQMLTVLQTSDGKPCEVGGMSQYRVEDGRLGISGTLKEWMACAGVSLDSTSDKTRSFAPGETSEPSFRITGVVLDLQLTYLNYHHHNVAGHDGDVCFVKVKSIPAWNSRTEMIYTERPGPKRRRTAYTYRYSQGVTVQIHVSGSFGFFDAPKLLNGLVSVIVLLGVPTIFIQFVAIFLLGLLSEIYYNAQRQVLNIYEAFHGISSRMMVSSIGFRGLTNQWRKRSHNMKAMEFGDIRYHMKEAFHADIARGVLDKQEIDLLATVVFNGLNTDDGPEGAGGVGFDEFVQTCSSAEVLQMKHMSSFFDVDRRRGCLERLLDDTRGAIKSAIRPGIRQSQTGLERELHEDDDDDNAGPPIVGRLDQFGPEAETLVESKARSEEPKTKEVRDKKLQIGDDVYSVVEEAHVHSTVREQSYCCVSVTTTSRANLVTKDDQRAKPVYADGVDGHLPDAEDVLARSATPGADLILDGPHI